MTTLGDTLYENATPAPARLAGNISKQRFYISQKGTGSISAAPSWQQPWEFNPKDFGAVGDGSTDDTQAFLDMVAALNAASGKCGIFIPPGCFIVKKYLALAPSSRANSVSVRGAGSQASIIYWQTDIVNNYAHGFTVAIPSAGTQYFAPASTPVQFRGLTLLTDKADSETAIAANGSSSLGQGGDYPFWEFEDLQLIINSDNNQSWHIGIDLTYGNNLFFKNIYFQGNSSSGNGAKGIFIHVPSTATINDSIMVSNCNLSGCDYDIVLDGAGQTSSYSGFQTVVVRDNLLTAFLSNIYWVNVGTQLGGSEDVKIGGNYFLCLSSGAKCINMHNVARVWIHDNFFDGLGSGSHIYMDGTAQNEELKCHDNMFRGNNSSETGINLLSMGSAMIHHNEFNNLKVDFALDSNCTGIEVRDNQYLDGSNAYRSNRGTNAASGGVNLIGNVFGFSGSKALTGGSPTETHYLDITRAGLIANATGAIVQVTEFQDVAVRYDSTNGSNSPTRIYITFFKYDGTNLGAFTYPVSGTVTPGPSAVTIT